MTSFRSIFGPLSGFIAAINPDLLRKDSFPRIVGFNQQFSAASSLDDLVGGLDVSTHAALKEAAIKQIPLLRKIAEESSKTCRCQGAKIFCYLCFNRKDDLKQFCAGILSMEAVIEYNNHYATAIRDFANLFFNGVFVVDVANILNSKPQLRRIVDSLRAMGCPVDLSPIENHLASSRTVSPDHRVSYLEFFKAYTQAVTFMCTRSFEPTIGFIFVNQAGSAHNGIAFTGTSIMWINIAFDFNGRRMIKLAGCDGSDDALMIEISRRLNAKGYLCSILSNDKYSEYDGCSFAPNVVLPDSVVLPPPRFGPVVYD